MHQGQLFAPREVSMKLLGYCMDKDGHYKDPIKIMGLVGVGEFLEDQVMDHYELRICDENDNIVLHVVDKRLVFPIPEGGSANNYWSKEEKRFVEYVAS